MVLNYLGGDIENSIYFKPNERYLHKYDLSYNILHCAGVLTSSQTAIAFNIPLDKSTEKISGITINNIKASIRHPQGGYIIDNKNLSDFGKLYYNFVGTRNLAITLELSSKTNFTNNTPLTVSILELDFTTK